MQTGFDLGFLTALVSLTTLVSKATRSQFSL